MIALTDPLLPGPMLSPLRKNEPAVEAAGWPRFTLDGNDELEIHLTRTCDTITAGLRGLIPSRRLQAVLLGGGYGRGEGGVLRTREGEHPYNDLEFYVCLRGNRHLNERRHHLPLKVLGEILAPMAGAEIEFKITSLAELRRNRISMFSYDLLMGHRRLLGDAGLLLGLTHHQIAGEIPAAEATRLLMNRCSGLLFAQERLERAEFTATDADFVQRNIAKAELAFGDAVLTAHGQYHWSCQERHRRLQRLITTETISWLDNVRLRHMAGLQFKLYPERSTASRDALQARQTAVVALGLRVWLWQERRRLDTPFASASDYAWSRLDKCPETDWRRNALVNLKTGGAGSLFKFHPFRHPRERVLRVLSLLLWAPADPLLPLLLDCPTAAFFSSTSHFAAQVAAYKALWERVH
ncbi:MAG TPA: hypothetical protein VK717_10730 [Opitutaceae bacterium]|jgi:hypothetical protein|nr:hypothetical protein [Opitutaceae bacterium]